MTNRQPLTVQEASEALDVSDTTIRRLLKRRALQQHSTVHGRIMITAESVEQVAQQIDHMTERTEEPPELVAPSQPEQPLAMGEVTQLTRSVEMLTEIVRDQHSFIRQLQKRIVELEAQHMDAEMVEEHDRAIAELQAAVESAASSQPGEAIPLSLLHDQPPKQRSLLQRILRRSR